MQLPESRGALMSMGAVLATHYPDAQRCADCGAIWIHGAAREHEMHAMWGKLANLKKPGGASLVTPLVYNPAPTGAGDGEA